MKELGQFIRQRRTDKNIKLIEAVGKSGLSSLSRIEHLDVDVTIDMLSTLQRTVGFTTNDLDYFGIYQSVNPSELYASLQELTYNEDAVRNLLDRISEFKDNPFRNIMLHCLGELVDIRRGAISSLTPTTIEELSKYLMNLTHMSYVEFSMVQFTANYVPIGVLKKWSAHFAETAVDAVTDDDFAKALGISMYYAGRVIDENDFDAMKVAIGQVESIASKYKNAYLTVAFDIKSLKSIYQLKLHNCRETRRTYAETIYTAKAVLPKGSYEYFKKQEISSGVLTEEDFKGLHYLDGFDD